MGFFRLDSKPKLNSRLKESGNAFLMLFGAVGMVGVIGAASMTVLKGPVKTMSEVTKRTIAENNMIAAGKLALIVSSNQADGGDCDTDGTIEPVPHGAAIAGFTGGGALPAAIGVAKEDPWGREYAYCTWDYGTDIDDAACGGAGQNRLRGSASPADVVLAIISAGPDGVFNTVCRDYVNPSTVLLDKTVNTDDINLGYTYAEAGALAGGVWNIKVGEPTTAEIAKDLEVTDSTGTNVVFGVDTTGPTPSIQVDYISELTGGADVEFLSPITSSSNISTSGSIFSTGNGVGRDSTDRVVFTDNANMRVLVNNVEQMQLTATNNDVELNGKVAFRSNDSWLRLNQTSAFTSGTYTPGLLRADGGFNVDNNLIISANGQKLRLVPVTGAAPIAK